MSSPTAPQIKIARDNLVVLRAINEEAQSPIQGKIINAYLLFSDVDNNDPGLTTVLSFVSGAFSAIGSEFGPGGSFIASFMSGMVNYWASATPPSLNTQFASYLNRFIQTSMEINARLDHLHGMLGSTNPEEVNNAWNTKYTGSDGKETAVSDLALHPLPTKGMSDPPSPDYDAMVQTLVRAHDKSLWQQMLTTNYYVPYYTWYHKGQSPEDPPWAWVRYALSEAKSFFYVCYKYYDGAWSDDPTYYVWIANEYIICLKNTHEWYYLPDGACDYLFKDSSPGYIINPDGLFTREEVVNFLGIKHVETVPYVPQVEFRPAVKPHGRELNEIHITDKAREDAVFADKLVKNPKPTLEEYFGIKLPEDVSLTVVLEDPKNLALVIRGAKKLGE